MEKVRSGETVTIRAATWNAFIDAANYVKEARQNQRGKGLKSGIQTGIILYIIPFLKILFNQIGTISYMKILQLKSNGISKIFLFPMFFTIFQLTFI